MRRLSTAIVGVGSVAVLVVGWLAGSNRFTDDVPVAPSTRLPTTTPTSPPSDSGPSAVPSPTEAVPLATAYDGQLIETKYGTVQVRVVFTDGVITDVVALKLTDTSETSVEISARAAPILREEVLAAQSAAVSNVSGATYTSQGYLGSVQSALDAAGFTG
ncbi:FMN-binding protein [Cryobacterium sp. TMT2-10]|uniref:FMN-binding protein n=1 Tax=Cryobacterium shii TaxID=1259235 RepID=A0AAQ2C6D7_9MICO|nr:MULTISPECIES: FMN-binding protein [Cryobacterium]TFC47267.1 FMN-binding protein [Cryobacterium shii]TFC85450.1 FMN-binding protein [Cryobacterium sp. TmT2-59]TFD13109.1 FMN-binding protein [Cryobacterium sp. TMT4-10]TFD16996.1 FMN-binding protein [Cryobacterium sp. TMT2-23]TFD38008.1 FMN-binding protein [Cryobacterium sp. TMT2-10]